MKKFFKILGVSLLSFAIVLSTAFVPFLCKSSNTIKSTSASSFDNTTQTYYTDNYSLTCISTAINAPDINPITIPDTYPNSVLLSFAFEYGTGSLSVLVNVQYYNYNKYFNSTDGYTLIDNYSFRQSGSLPTTMQLHSLTYFRENNVVTRFDTYLSSTKFNSNITRVVLNDYREYDLLGADKLTYSRYITFTYYDDSSNYLTIFMPFNNLTSSSHLYDTIFLGKRTYFLNSSVQFTDNDFYNQGLSDGYSDGLTAGKSAGYSEGFEAGEISGYSNGYNEGVENANIYTFTSLIGAVFDVPITAFTSLFNFNILGFNVLSFLTSLLTLCVVIFVLKLILGGK